MKKIFAIVAISSFALTATYAQSSGIPAFSSETEKKAWIEANPEQYRQAVKVTGSSPAIQPLQSNSGVPEFNSDAEKQVWIQANPDAYEAMLPAKLVKEQPVATEKFGSEAEKIAWIEANRGQYQKDLGKEKFASDAEKQAYLNAHPVVKSAEKREWAGQNHSGLQKAHTVKSTEKYASDVEKQAALKATNK